MVRVPVLGCPVDLVDMEGAVAALVAAVERGRAGVPGPAFVVVTLNPEIVMRARREPDLAAVIASAGLIVPDGVGIVVALRRRGHRGAVRVAGADLVEAYAERAAALGQRVALAGGAPGVAARAAAVLAERHPGLKVVATDSGDPGAAVAARLAAARPDVVLAAYGGGPQERFLAAHLAAIGAPAGMGVGGSLDFIAGRVRRAPGVVRRMGLEWAWRLARQPWRWRRQLVLPAFWWRERREAARDRAVSG